jgi:2-C-methyl-D-erythritol 4-phosphate cytidylyltransferase / 2-C-methyl-D-erythritol 2,4-cyclodiphosphate synthase
MHVAAIVPAAGRGLRFGASQPKQFLSIGGRTVLERSVGALLAHPMISEVVIALPADLIDGLPPSLQNASKPLCVVAGGSRRQDSVANAFRALAAGVEIVVVHDAARPFVSAPVIDRTIAAAADAGAAVAAVRARDTIKQARVDAAGRSASDHVTVGATLERQSIFLAQTPQAFRREVLREALAAAPGGMDATDEAALVERTGGTVRLVEGEQVNIKITMPEDLPIAEAIARTLDGPVPSDGRHPADMRSASQADASPRPLFRVGTGYDLHRLVDGRPLVLGGVVIPFDRGLAGHSDADAISHAVADAMLGAVGADDIGHHFPDTDPRWRGASSIDLLVRVSSLVRGCGFVVGNVDVTVVAERPRLAPYIPSMREVLAGALGVSVDQVSIKGKTNEGVGALGEGRAIAVHAVALVVSRAD